MLSLVLAFATGSAFGFLIIGLLNMAHRSDDEWIDGLDPEEDEDETMD